LLSGAVPNMLFNLEIKKLKKLMVFLSNFALFFGVFWATVFNWTKATQTHCGVVNYLPSVSAAIGYSPGSYVWRLCITLLAPARYMIAFAYWKKYSSIRIPRNSRVAEWKKLLVNISTFSNVLEITGLLLLTIVSSKENNDVHKFGFAIFMIGGVTHMILTCLLSRHNDFKHSKIIRKRKLTVAVHIISFVAALGFFYRHNKYCEPYVYTFFALCEYIIILSNIEFHTTFVDEIEDFRLVICDNEEFKTD